MKIRFTAKRVLLLLSILCFALGVSACPIDVLGQANILLIGISGILAIAGVTCEPLVEAVKIAAAGCLLIKQAYADYKALPNGDTLQKVVDALNAVHDSIAAALALIPGLSGPIATKITAILNSVIALLAGFEANLHATHAGTVANAQQS